MKKLFKLILDCLFPLHCLVCREEGVWLCNKCEERLTLEPSSERFERLLVFSACDYQKNKIKKIIKTCKFSAIPELGIILGKLLIKGLNKFPETKDLLTDNNLLLIPIPLSPKRERARGFNQSLLIAQELSKYFQIPINNCLIKKERPAQAELSGSKRAKNIAQAFSWTGERLGDFHILLVDDVVTTGATLTEAAKILKKAGAKRITGLVVAR